MLTRVQLVDMIRCLHDIERKMRLSDDLSDPFLTKSVDRCKLAFQGRGLILSMAGQLRLQVER